MENSPLEDHFLNGNFPRFSIRFSIKKYLKKTWVLGGSSQKEMIPGTFAIVNLLVLMGTSSTNGGFIPDITGFFSLPIPLILEDRGVIFQVRSQSSMAFKGGWRVRRRCRQESGHVEELVGYKPTHQRYHIIYLFIYHAYSTDTCIIQDRYRI